MHKHLLIAAGVIASASLAVAPAIADVTSYSTDFNGVEFNDGSGWRMTSAVYDAEIENGALRISNAVTSGSFGDWVFSPELPVAATEAGPATAFNAKFTLLPVDLQPGLRINVSPDNGEGGRGGFIAIEHTATGVDIVTAGSYFNADGDLDWKFSTVAKDLKADEAHTVTLKLVKRLNTAKNKNNDTFSIKVDGKPTKTTTFEAYYQATGEPNYETDTLLIQSRTNGAWPAQPSLQGKGLLIDNLSISTE